MKDVRLQLAVIITCITQVVAFVPSPSNDSIASSSLSKLNFGFNGLGTPNDEKEKNKKTKDSAATREEEKKITTKGLFQLIAAGMGAPFLGDYEGVDGVSHISYETNALLLFLSDISNIIYRLLNEPLTLFFTSTIRMGK
jgi:hypothetical protein